MAFASSTRHGPGSAFGPVLGLLAFILFFAASAGILSAAQPSGRGIALTVKTADGQVLPPYENSYALVVGVSRYQNWPTLESVPSELATVRRALEKQGFTVVPHIDPNSADLKRAFDDFISRYGYNAGNRLLFYYAGHGYSLKDGDNGYLVPADAPDPRKDETGFKRKALDMNMILAWCRSMDARHALFLFDSCFSGAIFKQRDLPAMPPSISRLAGQPVRQFITAGQANESVPARSTFTPAFVDALEYGLGDLNRDGYVSGTELGLYLSDKVPRHVHQTPQYGKISDYNLSRGDFIFVAGGSTVVSSPSPAGSGSGEMKVTTEPQGARVFVNNSDRGAAPLNLGNLKPGRYTLRAEKTGFAPQSRTVEVEAGRTASVRFYLEPVRLLGRLFVKPTPADATVKIMNIGPPYTPGMELDPGRYHIQVEKPGYDTVTRWETLAGGEDVNVSITLNKASAVSGASGSAKKISNDLGMEFVWIEPGSFMMGSPSSESGRDDDEKQHRVTLTKGFYMQTTDVTQGQWKAIMGSNPSHFSSCGDNCPVEQVSWDDVQAFIRKLNQRTGQTYRLPMEAEWEYACRAGTTGPFNTGDCLSTSQANYDGNYPLSGCSKGQYRKKTVPVASFSPNAWGLYDMHGNVWEWCADWYGEDYPSGSVTDPEGPSFGSNRVSRGGSWSYDAQICRSADRGRRVPGYTYDNLGFRLVLSPVR